LYEGKHYLYSRIRRINIILLFATISCGEANKNHAVPGAEKESLIDRIMLKDLDENVINLDKYKGQTIFLNFWATWCKPCIQEMPSIEGAKKNLENRDIIFLLASSESKDEIETFRDSHNYSFQYVRIENSEDLGIQILPTTFIFNPKGKLVFSETGQRKWDEKANIDLLLKTTNDLE
jgi:thiol-disulfide isomerase/thioredoxin